MNKAKISFISLGCSKNRVDTEVMLKKLCDAGYEIIPDESEAEIIIVNTCAFIEQAKQESIDTILEVASLKSGKLKGIVACGCLAERYREEVLQLLPEVDAIVGVGSIDEIEKAVESALSGSKQAYLKNAEQGIMGGSRVITENGITSYIKISEGCDNRCTYCAIPKIRGRYRSRPADDIIAEAKELSDTGVKELCLVAQDTTRYGEDIYGRQTLHELLRRLSSETEIPRFRLLYCYPDKLTDEIINEIATNPRVAKYIDIPAQHISENILTRMNRRGGSIAVKSAVERLRAQIPDVTIRTTFIVGFPGETEEDFNELYKFVKTTRFDRLGVFIYSPEEGTPAAEFADQIDEQTKQDRYDLLMSYQLDISAEKCSEKIGKTITVLCEGYDQMTKHYYGRGEGDAPDIDGLVHFTSTRTIEEGEFVDVKITEALDYDLIGNLKA
jgi:ribosomal protein S12 methylthiotransferase